MRDGGSPSGVAFLVFTFLNLSFMQMPISDGGYVAFHVLNFVAFHVRNNFMQMRDAEMRDRRWGPCVSNLPGVSKSLQMGATFPQMGAAFSIVMQMEATVALCECECQCNCVSL